MASYQYTFNSGDGVTPTRLNAARTVSDIVNADIKSDAAIAGTKIAPDFGAQNVATTGSIGAGTATPAEKLVVTGNASGSQIIAKVQNSATTASSQARVDLATGTANSFAIHSLTESGSGSAFYELSCGSGVSQGVFVTSGTTTAPIVFRQSGTERMRITSGGAVCIGTTENIDAFSGTDVGVSIAGSAMVISRLENTALRVRRVGNDGGVIGFNRSGVAASVGQISVTTTATSYGTTSDYRLKDNPQPMANALARLSDIKPVIFTWKSNGQQSEGFIAHELQAVVPEAVTGEKDAVDADGNPEYQGVDAAKIVPLLVAAVQELSAKAAALEAAQ